MPVHPNPRRAFRHRRNRAVLPKYFNQTGDRGGPAILDVHLIQAWANPEDGSQVYAKWSDGVESEFTDGFTWRMSDDTNPQYTATSVERPSPAIQLIQFPHVIADNAILLIINDHLPAELYGEQGQVRNFDLVVLGPAPA